MKSNEWYTPAKYIEAAREVMGGIDLDPASCELANQTVKAAKFYTKEENGLMQPWYGRVWLNPPFGLVRAKQPWQGRSLMGLFTEKLRQEYANGTIEQAIVLLKSDPKQHWFMPFWTFPICFVDDDVYFDRPNGKPSRHQFGTCFAYLGPHEQTFIDVFSRFGTVARRVSPAKERPVMRELWEVAV